MKYALLLVLVLTTAAFDVMATDRSTTERYAFDRMTPCPVATANPHVCPGYIRDHTVPLRCARTQEERNWLDSRYNMRWQTVSDAHAKDLTEKYNCLHGFPAPK